MKLDRGLQALPHIYRVIRVLYTLGDKSYGDAVLTSMMLLKYQRDRGLFAWKMFKRNLSVFNEESGESSFSVLGRCCLGDTTVNKFEHLNRMYQDIHASLHAAKYIKKDVGLGHWSSDGHIEVSKMSDDIDAAVSYIKSVIRSLSTNQHMMYDGKKDGYRNKTRAILHLVPLDEKVVRIYDILKPKIKMEERLSKLTDRYCGFWMHNFASVWPPGYDQVDSDDLISCSSASMTQSDGSDVRGGEYDGLVNSDDNVMDIGDGKANCSGEAMQDRGSLSNGEHSVDDDIDALSHVEADMLDLHRSHSSMRLSNLPAWGEISQEHVLPDHRSSRLNRGQRAADVDFPMVYIG